MRKKEDLKMLGDATAKKRSGEGGTGGFTFPEYTPPQYTAPEKFQMSEYTAPNPYQGKNYVNPYTGQVESLFQQISSRQPFAYDVNADALYQQMKDQYIQGGNLAMMDTMGQAQAMTGGYANTYAQTAGQQQFNQYLQGLNDQVPELYNLALQRYIQEGQDLKDLYSMASGQEDKLYDRFMAEDARDYGRWKDAADTGYRQWLDQVNLGYAQYQDDRNFGYQQNRDQANLGLELWLNQQGIAREDYLANREMALNQAQMMLEMGVRPSDEMITAAGLSPEYVNMFFPEDSGGNTGGWSALGDAIKGYWEEKKEEEDPPENGGTITPQQFYADISDALKKGQSNDVIRQYANEAVNAGVITQAEYAAIVNTFR